MLLEVQLGMAIRGESINFSRFNPLDQRMEVLNCSRHLFRILLFLWKSILSLTSSLYSFITFSHDPEFNRPKLEGIVNATENRPILGLVGSIVKDYLPLIDEYYYYSST